MLDFEKRSWISRLLILAAIGAGFYVAAGCTIIRYVDNNGTTTNGPPPKVVDMLVMVDMARSAANLTPDYGKVLGFTIAALGQQGVVVRRAAMAPLYSRAEGAVPLLYGEGDEDGEFHAFEEALAFYTYDDGASYLQDEVESDSQNLAVLGAELDSRAIYHPTTADPTSTPYFLEPADGFVVLYLSASPRRCSLGDSECEIDGVPPDAYFTAADDRGARWLELAGGASVPVGKVFHGAVVTAEGIDYDTFYSTCSSYLNFPTAKLDVMQPSEEHLYFHPLIEGVQAGGGAGMVIDLCEAMSGRGEATMVRLATAIRGTL